MPAVFQVLGHPAACADLGDLAGTLEAEGVLAERRLPGRRGSLAPVRSMRIDVGHGTKSFRLGAEVDAPWFDRVAEEVHGIAHELRWQ